ncbi:MAG: glycosyltransferase family A protein [Pseudomonadota bacterium]
MDFAAQVKAIRKTGQVHSQWYLDAYPDVARLGMEPAEHYLKYGAAMGRNPGKNFDTRFYLERYPDVAETGMNPLLHYARFGEREGRDCKGSDLEKDMARLNHYLWGGGPAERLVASIEEIADNPEAPAKVRLTAARKLAIWHAFQGDLPAALSRIAALPDITPEQVNEKSYLVTRAFLHLSDNDQIAARAALLQFLGTAAGQDDADALLALANTGASDADRLATINRVYSNAGLARLRLSDPAQPLALGNVTGDAVPPCAADHGLVSVIMPIFNAAETLETAIRSLCEQSYRNIEIVAVDDCSSDESFLLLQRLAAADPRIRFVRQEENGGAYPARNRGLKLARGDFVTTHDADDWSHPQKIETQLRALVSSKASGVVAHWVRVKPDLTVTTNWRVSSEALHWSHSSFLARKALFDELGPWDNVRISADTELIWRMQAAHGWHSLKKVMPHAPLALALDDETSLTRTKQTHVSTIYYGLRRFYREIAQYWHRQPGGLSPENHARRLKMVPEEMFGKVEEQVSLHLVLRGDCSDPQVVAQMASIIEDPAREGQRFGLDHRPNLDRTPKRFCNGFFKLLEREDVRLIVPGTPIRASEEIDLNG